MSWAPVDLGPYLRGEVPETRPVALARDDGEFLLYGGLVTWLSGESESLKSWLAQVAVAEQLRAGATALYLDFESDPLPIVLRMLALGVAADAVGRGLVYIRPAGPPTEDAERAFYALLYDRPPEISVLDGVNAAMAMSGFDANSSKDFLSWYQLVRTIQLATTGPTLAVDHVVKNPEGRGRYAIGSVSKLNAVDGAHLGAELVRSFGRGLTGMARIRLHKDRPGWLRGIAVKDTLAMLSLASNAEDGSIAATLAAATDPAADTFRPTVLMARVSEYLRRCELPVSQRAIRSDVTGQAAALAQAVNVLADEGYVAVERGSRGLLYRFIRPYAEVADGVIVPMPSGSREPVGTTREPVPVEPDEWFPVPPPIGGNQEPVGRPAPELKNLPNDPIGSSPGGTTREPVPDPGGDDTSPSSPKEPEERCRCGSTVRASTGRCVRGHEWDPVEEG